MTYLLRDLPGGVLVARGLADLARRQPTPEAWLVSVATGALRSLGLDVADGFPEPELGLYAALQDHDDPYGRYNALKRELDSFLCAAATLSWHPPDQGSPPV